MSIAVYGKGVAVFGGYRSDTGYGRAFALAFGVHALLIVVMFLGVRMQSSAPDTVQVELWEPPPPPRLVEAPKPEPRVEPKPEPEPPKPEPKIEKPQIVEKALPKPKPEAKPKPKAEVKPKPAPRDLDMERRLREQLALEQAAAEERQVKQQIAREQAAAQSRALAAWVGKIRARIRQNIRGAVVDQVKGNPEAVFDVALLPNGEVLTVRMRKSSGQKAYDDEVQRAIQAASPLPRPDQPNLFRRDLELKFRPLDQ